MSTEAQAKELGWTDQDAWVEKGGDPDKWRDADAYMEFGNRNAAFVRKVLEKENSDALTGAQSKFDERLKKMEQVNAEAMKRQRQNDRDRHMAEVATLKSQRQAAAQADDTAGVLKATEQLEDLTPPPDDVSESMVGRNDFDRSMTPLLMASPEVKTFSDVAAATISRDNPGMAPDEFYKELQAQIKDEFSDKPEFARYFGKRPKPVSKVDSSDGAPNETEGGSWDDLPPEAKQAGSEFITDGLYKDKAAYAAKYFEQE